MLHPTVYNTSQICYQLGVRQAVMSPGSRNAPLTVSFARNQQIEKRIIPDERAAGFIALGIAQITQSPVVLCCTSGTALLNYAPAIAEAYYREIPLIVISADRPPRLVDQRDGQTIKQFEVLKNHVKLSVQLPVIENESDAIRYERELINALKNSQSLPKGPVHINVPFEEPFYPEENEELKFNEYQLELADKKDSVIGKYDLNGFSKVLILLGQYPYDSTLNDQLADISKKVPVLKFPLSNLNHGISNVDLFINQQDELKPELLITSGLSVLSKKMKQFLRKQKPEKHIHLDPAEVNIDTFSTNPEILNYGLVDFLNEQDFSFVNAEFLGKWKSYSDTVDKSVAEIIGKLDYSETTVAREVLKSIPEGSNLHLSNSMPVRYADMFGVPDNVICYSNRGTSGIDGCTSTALGSALVTEELNVLVTGDLAFLYDRNAFFHNYQLSNLRVIVLNNQGGGIFRLIDGPSNLPELEEYFETRHNRTAEYICAENGLVYQQTHDLNTLSECLEEFYRDSERSKVLEIFTNPEVNQSVYRELKMYINERIKN
ncbi:2-succinyl-5-enolpyruvyl-6-hydroxy-3-cyclohexene-1-carboxylic-acid synthase [Ekhidna sp.]